MAHVAGPLGVMTTNAVTGPGAGACAGLFCWAEAVAIAITVAPTGTVTPRQLATVDADW